MKETSKFLLQNRKLEKIVLKRILVEKAGNAMTSVNVQATNA